MGFVSGINHGSLQVEVHQELLVQQIKAIFNASQTQINTKKQSNIKHPSKGSYLELDVWVPTHNICFEFQDSYHYTPTWYKNKTLLDIEEQDYVKQEAIRQAGLTLVVVPCWWSGDSLSLVISICFQRPDLASWIGANPSEARADTPSAIPLNPPFSFFSTDTVPGVGSLMLASFPQDRLQSGHIKPLSWWIGEKYDGVRTCWNPITKTSYSRNGNEISLLPKLALCFPANVIDGEYWFGRGCFLLTGALLKDSMDMVSWHLIRMIAFDFLSQNFHELPFETRYSNLVTDTVLCPIIEIAPRILYEASSAIGLLMRVVIDAQGEGLILRAVASHYIGGRSDYLLKLKACYGDREAIVVQKDAQNGIRLKLDDGKELVVPPASVLIPTPAVGEVVSFTYESYSRRDLPVNATIYRVRTDISWDNSAHTDFISADREYIRMEGDDKWTTKNMRVFMEDFARQKGLNPLLAETWYSISAKEIRNSKAGKSILQYYPDYPTALQQLFPDLTFNVSAFTTYSPWQHIGNRRKFFENFAAQNGFDPLLAQNWYLQSMDNLLATKGIKWIISYHGNSVANALLDLFPDIGLDKSKFPKLLYGPRNRRRFFEEYAKAHGFDPLKSENWYAQSKEQILSTKGAHRVLSYHHKSVSKAIADLFPHIGLDRKRFVVQSRWQDWRNRRKFFEDYAKVNHFNPYHAQSWYAQSLEHIMATKGAKGVTLHHKHKISNALMDLFPNIGLDKSKLWHRDLYQDSKYQKALFEQYAAMYGFNPNNPKLWYCQSYDSIMSFKGIRSVLTYYSYSLTKALLYLFPNIGLEEKLLLESFTNQKKR